MKKTLSIASAVLLMVGLTGCSSSGTHAIDPEPMPTYTETAEPTPTFTPKPTPTHTYTKDEIFISVIRNQYPYYANLYSDSELVKLGSLTCTYFDDGGTFEALAYYLVTNIDASEDAYSFMGFTIGAAVATYCPEYTYKVS